MFRDRISALTLVGSLGVLVGLAVGQRPPDTQGCVAIAALLSVASNAGYRAWLLRRPP